METRTTHLVGKPSYQMRGPCLHKPWKWQLRFQKRLLLFLLFSNIQRYPRKWCGFTSWIKQVLPDYLDPVHRFIVPDKTRFVVYGIGPLPDYISLIAYGAVFRMKVINECIAGYIDPLPIIRVDVAQWIFITNVAIKSRKQKYVNTQYPANDGFTAYQVTAGK